MNHYKFRCFLAPHIQIYYGENEKRTLGKVLFRQNGIIQVKCMNFLIRNTLVSRKSSEFYYVNLTDILEINLFSWPTRNEPCNEKKPDFKKTMRTAEMHSSLWVLATVSDRRNILLDFRKRFYIQFTFHVLTSICIYYVYSREDLIVS